MVKSIVSLKGTKQLTKREQILIHGGSGCVGRCTSGCMQIPLDQDDEFFQCADDCFDLCTASISGN
ncbi:hypothetical protein [Tenacibaculum agarivorans]|uniref:hypothetical protein n=1 Tax=Tenacibaculum agarivorans TaxID=1908389 RepID=UPI00094B8119|nr:hypothetical protein [Tenacibaculum agarivorans]